MNPVHGITGIHRLGYYENTVIHRFFEGFLDIRNGKFLVGNEAVGPLAYHAEAFLYRLFETAPYGHYLSNAFHAAADFPRNAVELRKIPARDFADDIIEGRLEKRRSRFRYRIFQIEKSVSETELGGHEGKRIARRLGCKGG